MQTEETPRIEINSQIANESKSTCQKSYLRILLVDDDPCILEVSKQILATENKFEIDDATSVDEALNKMEKQTYDAVISDYEMPLKNGLDFLKELRKQQKDVPFILFTGKGREEVVITALNLGADGYVNKQGDPETVYGELVHNVRIAVEKARAEEALRDSEAKYSAVVNQATDGVYIIRETVLEFANESLAKIVRYSVSELENQPFLNFVAPESRESLAQRVEDRFAGEKLSPAFEAKFLCKDGTTRDVELAGTVIHYGGKPAVLGIARDITERKKAEEDLRVSEEKLRRIFESSPDPIVISSLDAKIIDCNSVALKTFGYSTKREGIGRSVFEFFAEKDRGKVAESLARKGQI